MPRLLAAFVCVFLALPAVAQTSALDPGTNSPYVWRVVIQAKPHPLLSPTVRDQLARDVKATLQSSVGQVARVEVIDLAAARLSDHDQFWGQFTEKSWAALETPAARKITGVKTHFLKIEVRDRKYHLEAKQLDGDTGLTSPVLRVQKTEAGEKLGRWAGMMLAPDFGPVGTVNGYDAATNTATVRFRAGGVEGFDKFVQPGDVLAVSRLSDPPRPAPRYGLDKKPTAPEPTPERDGKGVDFTLLQVGEPVGGGVYRCQLLTRYVNRLSMARGVAGYRGIKLATVDGPVVVRLVKPGGSGQPVPLNGLIRVRATGTDFEAGADPRDVLEFRDGVFRSIRPQRNVAWVYVQLGDALGKVSPAKFVIPVLAGGSPTALPYEPNEADAARAEFLRACDDLRARVAEVRVAQVALFEVLSKLIEKGELPTALDRATKGRDQLKATEKALSEELARLRGDPAAKDSTADSLLVLSDEYLQGLRLGEPPLRERIEQIQAGIEKSRDPARYEKEFRAKELMARIKQHLEQGEGDEALAQYDQLVALTAGQKDIKEAREKLAAEWAPKADEQKRARAFLAGEWRRASAVEEMKTAVPTVQEATGVLVKYDDKHGLRGLLASLEPAYTRLKEQADLLDPNTPTDKPTLTDLQSITNALREVETKARECLKKLDPAKDKP